MVFARNPIFCGILNIALKRKCEYFKARFTTFYVSKEGCYPLILGLGMRTCRPIYTCECAQVFVKIKSNLINKIVTCTVPMYEVCVLRYIHVL